jgi:NAD(P)-dependent dehydrogenase (short-subunit alcohol dehydrogenase family)
MSIRTWLVTGCSSGFGRALAQVLLERGEQVVVTARTPEKLAEWISPHAQRALALKLDITRQGEIAAAVASAHQRFGSVDVLVNNAAYGAVGTVEETPIDVARSLMETNYFGTLAMIRAVLPDMLARGSGHIVNIGSVAGQIGFPLLAYYSASKFALAGMSESMAAELRPLGIRVTLAELGPFATEFTRNMAVNRPAPHYDGAALAQVAGNAGWGVGEDPRAGATALLAAVNDPDPPVRMILGQPAIDVMALHDARRAQARDRWLPVSRLRDTGT